MLLKLLNVFLILNMDESSVCITTIYVYNYIIALNRDKPLNVPHWNPIRKRFVLAIMVSCAYLYRLIALKQEIASRVDLDPRHPVVSAQIQLEPGVKLNTRLPHVGEIEREPLVDGPEGVLFVGADVHCHAGLGNFVFHLSCENVRVTQIICMTVLK